MSDSSVRGVNEHCAVGGRAGRKQTGKALFLYFIIFIRKNKAETLKGTIKGIFFILIFIFFK